MPNTSKPTYTQSIGRRKGAIARVRVVKVAGGGLSSQVDAISLGISRSLAKLSDDHRKTLRTFGLLTRDARVRERRKYGLAHAARAQKSSPKR